MDADAELDAALGRKAGVALDHPILHLDGAAHGVDDAAELYETSVAGALHRAAVMHGHGGIGAAVDNGPPMRHDDGPADARSPRRWSAWRMMLISMFLGRRERRQCERTHRGTVAR